MPIPQSQLDTWSHQGAIVTSSAAYASIKQALLVATSPLTTRKVEVSLQGSYANSTNIYGDSDIDVVVLCEDAFHWDMPNLTPEHRRLHEALYGTSTYLWSHLRDETLTALRAHYPSGAVKLGHKSIKVQTGYGTKPADVVPALRYRRYATFVDRSNYTMHPGMQFFDSSNNPIVNYPKYHRERGEEKNQTARTNGRYKPTVRVFKNLRNYLLDHSLLAKGIAPSYFIECALHNVSDERFTGAFSDSVPAILDYLRATPFANFWCQNGIVPLIGTSPTQWPKENLAAFVHAASDAWSRW